MAKSSIREELLHQHQKGFWVLTMSNSIYTVSYFRDSCFKLIRWTWTSLVLLYQLMDDKQIETSYSSIKLIFRVLPKDSSKDFHSINWPNLRILDTIHLIFQVFWFQIDKKLNFTSIHKKHVEWPNNWVSSHLNTLNFPGWSYMWWHNTD